MAAPGVPHIYAANLSLMKLSDLTSADVRLALVTSSYTPNITATGHDEWADVSANEIAGGTGYTTGGYALATEAVAAAAANDGFKFSTGNATWTASGAGIAAFRYGVLYVVGTLWTRTNPLLAYFVGDSAPADVPATAAPNIFGFNCPADGWFKLASS